MFRVKRFEIAGRFCQNCVFLTFKYDVKNACLLVSIMATFYLLYSYAVKIQMHVSNTFKNKLTTFLRNALHKKTCEISSVLSQSPEMCKLHRFHIWYILQLYTFNKLPVLHQETLDFVRHAEDKTYSTV